MKALQIGLLTLFVLTGSGCKRGQPDKTDPAPKRAVVKDNKAPAVAKAAKAAATPGTSATPQPSEQAAPASVAGVADLSLAVVEAKAQLAAVKLNTQGFRRYRKKKYAEAAKAFTAALSKDPAHLTARYNLACTAALQGEKDKAIALLGQFKRAGCVLCLKQLVNAAKDNDFAGLRVDARFKRITDGVVVKEPDYRAAARRVLKALVRGNSSPAVESVKAGRAVLYASTWEDMSDGADPPETSYNLVKTLAEANAFGAPMEANDVPYPFKAGKLGRCKGTCCTVVQEGGMNIQDIGEVCFWPVSADKAVLVSVSVTLCGA